MKTHRIMALVLSAAVLAVASTSFASAMVPSAQLNSVTSASWITLPSNHLQAVIGGTFTETCSWKQNLYTTYSLDGIYCYQSFHTAPNYNQVDYPEILNNQYGQTVQETTTVTTNSQSQPHTDTDYNLCLGFWVNDPQLHNSFTSTETEYLTLTR